MQAVTKAATPLFMSRRAAPVKLAVRDVGRKRIHRPGLRAERHGIDMAGEAERQLGRRAAQTRKDLRPPFAERNELDRKTGTLQQARQPLRARPFGPGGLMVLKRTSSCVSSIDDGMAYPK